MSNGYIIDITMEEFKEIPISLDGEVLLERTLDSNGNVSGYLTITVDKIMSLNGRSDEELNQLGLVKYKHIIDSF